MASSRSRLIRTDEQIQAAIELPAKWQAYGEALFDLFGDTDFERLQDVYGRQTNRIMERVLRYFPMRRIRGASKNLADEVQGELDGRSPFRRSFVGRGFTHARQHLRGRQPALWLDATAVGLDAVDRQEHYVTHAELVTDLNAIFDSHDVREAVIQRYGKRYHDSLMRYIERIANPDIYQAHDPLIQLMDQRSVNFTIGTLAFKIPTALLQTTGVVAYLPEAGLGRLINAIRQGLPPNLLALRDFVHERDPQVANRTMDPFVAELKSLTRAPSNRRAARIYRRVVQVNGTIGMFILKALDKWSVLVGWKAVYDNVYAIRGRAPCHDPYPAQRPRQGSARALRQPRDALVPDLHHADQPFPEHARVGRAPRHPQPSRRPRARHPGRAVLDRGHRGDHSHLARPRRAGGGDCSKSNLLRSFRRFSDLLSERFFGERLKPFRELCDNGYERIASMIRLPRIELDHGELLVA